MPRAAPTFTAGGFLQDSQGDLDTLILHYDILRPHHKGFGSHADDPATSTFGYADEIAFLTLRTTSERLRAQLDQKIADYRLTPKKLRKVKPLYENDAFVSDWYERWFEFVDRFRNVTTASYLIDTSRDYFMSPAPATNAG